MLQEKSLWDYVGDLMVVQNPHVVIWYQNILYVGQDTNAAIVSYHGTLKARGVHCTKHVRVYVSA